MSKSKRKRNPKTVLRLPDPEHPSGFLYRPTFDLMKHLGLGAKEELPEYQKFQELLKVFEAQNAPEAAGAGALPSAAGAAIPKSANPPGWPVIFR